MLLTLSVDGMNCLNKDFQQQITRAITCYIKKFALMNDVNPLLNQNYTCKMKWLLLSAQIMVKSSN